MSRAIFLAMAGLVLVLALGAPAMASPLCTGSSCNEGASVSVSATITESISPTSFVFDPGVSIPAGEQVGPLDMATGACTWFVGPYNGFAQNNYCPTYVVTVSTGDGQGYALQNSGTNFTAPNGATFPIAGSLTEPVGVKPNTGFLQVENTTPTTTPTTILTQPGPSATGGDAYSVDDILQIPASAGNDVYSTTLTYSAIAN